MEHPIASVSDLRQLGLDCGATHAAPFSLSQLVFADSLRDMCAMNSCGAYGKCWVCPPAIGPVALWREKIACFDGGVLFQTVFQLEDSLDIEGMMAAKDKHSELMRRVADEVRVHGNFDDTLILGAGACELCAACTYPDEPCRLPDQALVSVEACGIEVNQTLVNSGLHYNNGPDTVSYVGMALYRERKL